MDWFPQGNQSVFWQAMLDNDNHDLKINIKAGGPGVKTANLVAAGQVEFGPVSYTHLTLPTNREV